MQYRIEISSTQQEDILIYAKEKSEVLQKIESLLERHQGELFGYQKSDTVKLNGDDIYVFCVESGKVYALTEQEKWQVKERLYQLEQQYAGSFVKINQSCLINLSKIEKFRTSIGGSLAVVLKNGYQDYVSRRQLKTVKERMGL